jgi:hypothetical protein
MTVAMDKTEGGSRERMFMFFNGMDVNIDSVICSRHEHFFSVYH